VIGIVLRQVTLGQQTYQIDIADSGRGVPPAVQPHLGAAGVTSGGTGFGLTMVRRIIETDHLGTVAILTREGTGTLVRIHLPRSLARPA
jgi:signal transduction histidine kinase